MYFSPYEGGNHEEKFAFGSFKCESTKEYLRTTWIAPPNKRVRFHSYFCGETLALKEEAETFECNGGPTFISSYFDFRD